jgi:hypothetical protein
MNSELEGDPSVRMARLLEHDMRRKRVYDRVNALIKEHQKTFNGDPLWVRVPLWMVYGLSNANDPIFSTQRVVCGLKLIIEGTDKDTIEVGNSVYDSP